MTRILRFFLLGTMLVWLIPPLAWGGEKSPPFESAAKPILEREFARDMVRQDIRNRLKETNIRVSQSWYKVKSRADWEAYKTPRIEALRKSLGYFPAAPKNLTVTISKKFQGDGFRLQNIVYESRPGLLVTANLYLPARPVKSMPGIMIIHSHHNPKSQGELQDMGMTWARLGCAVLIPDQLGHGERRQHPFQSSKSYPKSFRVSRQDYYFRYNVGQQLYLIGDSLIGWMANDMSRGVDVLYQQSNIDKKRIILFGSVAGGGDPAAVTAALDTRITAAAPFNFGGPQPESPFPLPKNAEETFNYVGGGSWESTRNLKHSARDEFLPWVIVGSIAPRPLIYAHEFAWDFKRDPVWDRFEKIYKWYDKSGLLSETHGEGSVRGSGSGNTHCNNIGAVHRKKIYEALQKWYNIPAPKKERQTRLDREQLVCLTPKLAKRNQPVWKLARERAQEQIRTFRNDPGVTKSARAKLIKLRETWDQLLGGVEKSRLAAVGKTKVEKAKGVEIHRFVLYTEANNILVPVVLLRPEGKEGKLPVVIAVAREGKAGFLKHQRKHIQQLLDNGIAVCLPDLRGTGETRVGTSLGRQTSATSLSAAELMLGKTILGNQCRDLLMVIHNLRKSPEIDGKRVSLWGHSFAKANGPKVRLDVPLDAGDFPEIADPSAALVVLLAALLDGDIHAVCAHGGLASHLQLLESPFVYVPHDSVIPDAFKAGDIDDLTQSLSPRPLLLSAQVDGRNRLAPHWSKKMDYHQSTRASYQRNKAGSQFRVNPGPILTEADMAWFARQAR